MKINGITNNNVNLETKVNFFFDYFSFANHFIGKMPFLRLDTPFSILDKILFQLEENIHNSRVYIHNHIRNFDFFQPELFSKFTHYENFKQMCDAFKEEVVENTRPDGKIKWQKVRIIFDPNFKNSISKFHFEIENDFFDHLLNAIYTQLVCKHKLRFHKKELKHLSVILVSQFRLNGHTKQTVETVIRKILDNNPENIILPFDLRDKSEEVQTAYLSKSSFKMQFNRIKILYTTIDKNFDYFILKVNNCYPYNGQEKSFNFEYNNVRFITPMHTKLKLLRLKANQKEYKNEFSDWHSYFFAGETHLLAVVKIYYEDIKDGVNKAIGHIKEALKYLKLRADNIIYVDESGYLLTKDFKDFRGQKSLFNDHVNYFDIEKLQNNLHFDDEARRNNLVNYFLQFEDLYFNALLEDSITKYWQYLECLIPKKKEGENGVEKNQVKEVFKKLLKYERKYIRKEMAFSICWSMNSFNIPCYVLGWDKDEHMRFYNEVRINTQRIDKFFIDNDFAINLESLKEFRRILKVEFKKSKSSEWKEFLETILTEIQEYRNSDLHKSKNNKFLERKLIVIIPSLIKRMRREMLELFDKNSHKNIFEVFE